MRKRKRSRGWEGEICFFKTLQTLSALMNDFIFQIFFFLNLLLVFTRLLCSPPTKQMSHRAEPRQHRKVWEVRLTGWFFFFSVPLCTISLTHTYSINNPAPATYIRPAVHNALRFSLPDMWKPGKQRWRAWWRSVQSCGWWRYCKARSRTWQGTGIEQESMREIK